MRPPELSNNRPAEDALPASVIERIERFPARGRWRLPEALPRHELAIALGAVIGVLLRFTVDTAVERQLPGMFPAGTLVVNLIGCFWIGVAQTLFLDLIAVRRVVQLFVSVGILGGFTTFSTFSVETILLLQAGPLWAALLYQVATLAFGLLAAVGGIWVARVGYRFWQANVRR
jgi:fluoride exporter